MGAIEVTDLAKAYEGTRAVFRPRDIPGGDAAAYVKTGLSRGDAMRLVVTVDAPVTPRIGPWARGVASDETTCRLEIEADDARWAAFGLAMLEAPVTLESAPPEVVATLEAWSGRLAAATASLSGPGSAA